MDIFLGGHFNIERAGGEWTIWLICDDEGNREQIILTQSAMDDLADYFADFYASDRAKARAI